MLSWSPPLGLDRHTNVAALQQWRLLEPSTSRLPMPEPVLHGCVMLALSYAAASPPGVERLRWFGTALALAVGPSIVCPLPANVDVLRPNVVKVAAHLGDEVPLLALDGEVPRGAEPVSVTKREGGKPDDASECQQSGSTRRRSRNFQSAAAKRRGLSSVLPS